MNNPEKKKNNPEQFWTPTLIRTHTLLSNNCHHVIEEMSGLTSSTVIRTRLYSSTRSKIRAESQIGRAHV